MSNGHRFRRHLGRNVSAAFSSLPFDPDREFRALLGRTLYRDRGFVPLDECDGNSSAKPSAFQVKNVDFLPSENAKAHHTGEYDIVQAADRVHQLVVRRGQPFDINIDFSKPYNKSEYELKLIFEIGENPRPSKETSVNLLLSDKQDETSKWEAKINSSSENTVQLTISTPPHCIVGKWRFSVDVLQKSDQKETFRYKHKRQIYILFNPWCKDDLTYFPNNTECGPDNQLLEEYVLNESGKIYTGSYKNISGKPWNFGQFEGDVLDCILWLLAVHVPAETCWNPIHVVRKLSALINSPDDSGILSGNWSGDYRGGTSPLKWSGSVAIIEEYYKTKSPVRFGQCWVFSGLFTTALRALGIPGRSVTNFASAHDNDGSTTIDIHFNAKGDEIEELNSDSVWNFHVWNEAYMARPDLPAGYGGWQACDATPQEASHGIYCCGPVSVAAVKNGDVNYPYDAPFVFAEVNADKIYWTVDEDFNFKKISVNEKVIGQKISTKKPGKTTDRSYEDPDREDLTLTYKYAEGSDSERAAVTKANQLCSNSVSVYKCTDCDVEFKFAYQENCEYGKSFDVVLQVKNSSKEKKTVSGQIKASSVFYTGVFGSLIKSAKVDVTMDPESSKEIKMDVTYDDYEALIIQHCMIKLSVLCMVEETHQIYTEQDTTSLCKPTLTIKAVKEVQADKKFNTEITFINPLPVPLTSCVLTIEGPGLQKPMTLKQPTINANGTFFANIELTPTKLGVRDLIANFSSEELEGIHGMCSIEVKEATEK